MNLDDSALEPTIGIEDPRNNDGDGLISDRDRIAAALFNRPVAQTHVGRYVIERELGSGAMGVVYEGRDEDLDRTVAIKVVQTSAWDSEDAIGRFRREAQALARLSHPNVVTIHEIGESKDRHFIAMELVRGRTLREWVHDEKPDWRAAIDIFVQAGRGLAAAHCAELVHRDFKPANCIVGDDGRVRVLDFGLARGLAADTDEAEESRPTAKVLEATLTATGALIGTPAYMAPEQLRGKVVDAASDQFAFCVSLYEALIGVRPFSGNSAYALHDNIRIGVVQKPENSTDAPPPAALIAVVVRGLAYKPSARWPDMASLLDALLRVPIRRRRRRMLAAGAVVGTLAVGVIAFAQRDNPCGAIAEIPVPGWSDDDRASVEHAIISSREQARPAWEMFERAADRWATDWIDGRQLACENALVDLTATPGVYTQQASCFDQRARTFETYLRRLSVDEHAWQHAPDFAEALPQLSGCTNAEQLQAVEPPAPDIAAGVLEVRALLDRAQAERISGDVEGSIGTAEEAWALSADLDYPQIRAELNLFRADGLTPAESERASERLLAALRDAEIARDDQLAGRVANQLAYLAAEEGTQGDQWLVLARAKLARTNSTPAAEAAVALVASEIARLKYDGPTATREADRALERLRSTVGVNDVAYLTALGAKALALEVSDDLEATNEAHSLAVSAHRRVLGEHPRTAATVLHRALFRAETDQRAGAARDFDDAVSVLREVPGEEERLSTALMGRTVLRSMNGKLKLEDVEAAIAPLQGLPENALPRLTAMQWRAAALQRSGRLEDALAEYDRALELLRKRPGITADELGDVRNNAAECLLELGRLEPARLRFTQALADFENVLPSDDPTLAYPLSGLGRVALAQDQPRIALRFFERGFELIESNFGDALLTAQLEWGLASTLAQIGEEEERARRLAKSARERLAKLGEDGEAQRVEIDAWLSTSGPTLASP